MAKSSQVSDARLVEQVRTAPFIFTGRVMQPGGSTVREIAPAPGLAVLRLEEVFRAPATLGDLKGTRLTIQLAGTRPLEKGASALFYATSWMYSDGLAVVELGREVVPRDPTALHERVARAEVQAEDGKLVARLQRAELVVSGMVERVSLLESQRTSFTTEHDPQWWQAELLLDRVEKGQVKEPRVTIVFPASLDEYWIDVPKLQEGQRGVFLLHRDAEGKRSRMRPPTLAILDPLDVHPMVQGERVRALLKLAALGG